MQINVVNVNKNVTVNNGANSNSNVHVETNVAAINSIVPQDILEISGQQPQQQAVRNRPFNADIGRMREIWTDHDRHVDSFRRLVEGLLGQQIERNNTANRVQWGQNMVEITQEVRDAAQEAISEGGPFSVEAVATRLLDFAVAVSGGDPSRIAVLRRAVERGFEAAERQWGRELPEISQRTREAVMEGFDQWQENGNAADITLLDRTASTI